jgi:hypothetical protein
MHASDVVRCPPAPRAGSVVGAVTNVLHSKVYVSTNVGTKYVGTTPFDIVSGSSICTDATGEALFELTRSKRSVFCITLDSTVVQVTPTVDLTASFQKGETWCSIRPTDGTFSIPIGAVQLRASKAKAALFGIVIRSRALVIRSRTTVKKSATIKVVEGSVSGSTQRQPFTVPSSREKLISSSGEPSTGTSALGLTAEERVAIAQLRLARPNP